MHGTTTLHIHDQHIDQLKKHLAEKGWWKGKCHGQDLDAFLLEIAVSLGDPVGMRRRRDVIEILKPIRSGSAYPNSLSKQYALSEFPIHCDTAHWPTPCRYIVIGCNNKGSCGRKTILVDWKSMTLEDAELSLLKSATLIVKHGKSSFYSPIIHENELYARYDPGCMFPASNDSNFALSLFDSILDKAEKSEACWKKNDVVVIDNWRILHGRGKPSQSSDLNSIRELHRVLVA